MPPGQPPAGGWSLPPTDHPAPSSLRGGDSRDSHHLAATSLSSTALLCLPPKLYSLSEHHSYPSGAQRCPGMFGGSGPASQCNQALHNSCIVQGRGKQGPLSPHLQVTPPAPHRTWGYTLLPRAEKGRAPPRSGHQEGQAGLTGSGTGRWGQTQRTRETVGHAGDMWWDNWDR